MSLQLLVTTAASVAAEAEGEAGPAVPVWVVGLIAFGILMALLVALLVFGGGREHS